jgi:hypothetical protein
MTRSEPRAAPIVSAASLSMAMIWPLGASPICLWQARSTSQVSYSRALMRTRGRDRAVRQLRARLWQAVVSAGSAVFGPSARLEVPEAESPDPLFAAFSSSCRSVNSWKNRSPTGQSSITAAMFSTSLRERLVKIGARIVPHGHCVVFQVAELAVPQAPFAAILRWIDCLRARGSLTRADRRSG